jgi:hypothetical protein
LEKVHLIGLASSLSSTRQTSAGRLLVSCFTAVLDAWDAVLTAEKKTCCVVLACPKPNQFL